jgi:hypothetical protein
MVPLFEANHDFNVLLQFFTVKQNKGIKIYCEALGSIPRRLRRLVIPDPSTSSGHRLIRDPVKY